MGRCSRGTEILGDRAGDTSQGQRGCGKAPGVPQVPAADFYEYAAQSVKKSLWARCYYKAMRAKGVKHRAALRALAYKWIRIMFRCWKERIAYSEAAHQAALVRANSPLASRQPALKRRAGARGYSRVTEDLRCLPDHKPEFGC